MKKLITLIYIGCLLSLASFGWAQVNLEVSLLRLPDLQPVKNIQVYLENPAIGYRTQSVSNAQGKVWFRGLSTLGAYQVSVPENGQYLAAKITGIDLRAQAKPSVQLLLTRKNSKQLDEVVVSAATSKINTINAEVASDLQLKEIQALPIEGRDITRALYRLPNITQATGFYPEAPNISINGANSLFTNYMIDGMDNNERFLGGQKFAIPVGFTKNITVLTNNYSTEFGLTGNGIVNITSRSGSNQLSGEVFLLVRPGSVIDSPSEFAQRDLSGNQVKDGFQRYQTGFGLGGALIKNKTFYYINAEQTIDVKDNLLNSPDLNINETVRGQNRFTYLSGKIDHFWSKYWSTTLRANVGISAIERQGGGLEGGTLFPSAASLQDRNSTLIALKNLYTGKQLTWESNVQFARFRWNYGRPQNGESPQVNILVNNLPAAVLGHPGFIFDSHEKTWQIQQKLEYSLNSQHTIKAGLELLSAQHSLFGGGNINGNYTVLPTNAELASIIAQNKGANLQIDDVPATVQVLSASVELRPNSFGGTQNIYSAYVEDVYSVTSRLNVILGLRYDFDNLSQTGAGKGDFNNIAPRFSFNYKLNASSSIRGGIGTFFEKILYAVYSDALQQNTRSDNYLLQLQQLQAQDLIDPSADLNQLVFDGNLTANVDNVGYLQAPAALQNERNNIFSNERRILSPNGWQNPYTHQISLGYQYEFDRDFLFYVDLVHNQSYNLFRLRNLNAPKPFSPSQAKPVRTQTEADFTRPVPILTDANGSYAIINGQRISGIARNVVVSETAGRSTYWGASFNLQKAQGKSKVSYRFTYTLSLLENNTEDINFRAMDANNFEAEWGPALNDRRHVINGVINFFPIKNFTVTTAFLLQSGQPINRIPDASIFGTTDLNGDGRSFGDAYVGNSDRSPGEPRNSDRLPWSNTFDLSLRYQIPLGKNSRHKFEISADVFNVFDAENLSGFSNNASQSNQIQVGPRASGNLTIRNAAPPRQFQFGARYVF
ncbi:TonB-dependent receptor [Microscilla marina]|uniref:TonB-dependent receptor domain protein n=1 Tax=Microscilla marina ATCC 23134 TaxID=313606 RepID=A1ZYS6_MICM2|nr:TonB-dependent receptor [Microscilla marina]EAY24500.1 TonB-dependent receptor domain protein [Microscilla marina ATCC 23134]